MDLYCLLQGYLYLFSTPYFHENNDNYRSPEISICGTANLLLQTNEHCSGPESFPSKWGVSGRQLGMTPSLNFFPSFLRFKGLRKPSS
jgi:hypothetical protein